MPVDNDNAKSALFTQEIDLVAQMLTVSLQKVGDHWRWSLRQDESTQRLYIRLFSNSESDSTCLGIVLLLTSIP